MGTTHRILCAKQKKYRELFNLSGHILCSSTGDLSQGRTTTKHLQEIQKMMAEKATPRSKFQGMIVFMSMFSDIEFWTNQNESKCSQSAVEVASSAREFAQGRWSFLGPRDEEKWYGTSDDKPKGKLDIDDTNKNRRSPHERTSCIPMFLPA